MDKVSNTANLLVAAIKAEALRQKTIADNIANLETPGYRRGEVKFEELLAKAMDSQGNVDVSKVEPIVHQPRNTPVKGNGNDVSLETEVGEMIKNSLRHETLVRLLHKKVKGLDAIINVP
jgi:flagellar basal-body rod protein FlgB